MKDRRAGRKWRKGNERLEREGNKSKKMKDRKGKEMKVILQE